MFINVIAHERIIQLAIMYCSLIPLICQCLWICASPLPCHLLISLDFLIFSPIRSLIESGFGASKRSDVRLYYGARNLKRMAYQVCLLLLSQMYFVESANLVHLWKLILKLVLLPLIGEI
jgi:hypothetical protein